MKRSYPRWFIVTLVVSMFGLVARSSAAVFPLKIGTNGRFLANQQGEPFLVVGDSAWSLIVQPSEDDIDHYLEDRQKRGFNSIIVNLIEHKFCTVPPMTRAGLAPFKKAGDFSMPNPDYFDFAHKVVKKANDRGIVVWLFPAYLGYGGGDEGFFQEMKAGGKPKLHSYGRFVGKRFKDLPNIVWVLGGDCVPGEADQWTVMEVAAGIREEDATHLMSGDGSRGKSAVTAFGNYEWLSVNTAYTGEKTLFDSVRTEYDRHPTRPFVLIEAIYECEHNSRPDQDRFQAYCTMLGGACGQFFGNNPIWHFDGPGLFPTKATWKEALDGIGTEDMARLRDLFVGMPWHRLEPEKNHEVITEGYGEGVTTALTARTTGKRLSITYVPSTGTESRNLTVNLAQFSGPIIARWYNPTNGRWTIINDDPFSNRGPRTFHTLGDNGTKTNDWLLVLEAR